MHGHNVIYLGLWSARLTLPGVPTRERGLLSSLTFSRTTPRTDLIPANMLRLVMDAYETLILVYLLRGLPNSCLAISAALGNLATALSSNSSSSDHSGKGSIQSYIIRTEALKMVSLLPTCNSEVDLAKYFSIYSKVQHLSRECADSDVNPDVTVLLCQGLHALSGAQLRDASTLFHTAAQQSLLYIDQVKHTTSMICYAWCSFISGERFPAGVDDIVEKILHFAASTSNTALHVWALELDIVLKSFANDFDGAEESLRLIRSLQRKGNPMDPVQRKENFSATTSAIIAYSYLANMQFDRASVHSIYACTKLAERKQGTVFGGLLLYLSSYAALGVVYGRMLNVKRTRSTDEIDSPERSFTRGRFYLQNHRRKVRDAPGNTMPRWRAGVLNSMRSVDRVSHGHVIQNRRLVDAARSAIECLSQLSFRFRALAPFLWILSSKLQRVSGSPTLSTLADFDEKIRENVSSLRQFTFAESFIHLERIALCTYLGVSTDFERVGDSLKIAEDAFLKLGRCPIELSQYINATATVEHTPDE